VEDITRKPKPTKRLYIKNPYQIEFKAKVIKKGVYSGKSALILDQSCFYPESGGQPSDRGTINGVRIFRVSEEEKILHFLEEEVPSEKIEGKVDWQTRFDHMQQHTGQHILSQSFYKLLAGETLSFHIGNDFSTVEIDLRKITEEDTEKVERLANEIVFQDREIKTYFISEERIKEIPLRKPPQKRGLIRIVEVVDFDYSACGGTHCRRTGEIGLIKILKWERIRNNIRFEFICGERALSNYAWKNRILRQLSIQLTVNELEIIPAVEKIFSDLKTKKKKVKKMQEKISQYEAQNIIQNAKEKVIRKMFVDKTPEEVRFLALNIIKRGDYVVLYVLKMEERGHLILASSENLKLDMRELIPLLSPLIKGKGGGSPSLVEITAEDTKNLDLALNRAYEFIKEKLSINNI